MLNYNHQECIRRFIEDNGPQGKIPLIKQIRAEFGLDLRGAKDAVDNCEASGHLYATGAGTFDWTDEGFDQTELTHLRCLLKARERDNDMLRSRLESYEAVIEGFRNQLAIHDDYRRLISALVDKMNS